MMDKLMPFISRKYRKNEETRSAILLEKQVRHAGENNLPLKIFKYQDLSLATDGFTTKLNDNRDIYDYYKATIDGVQVLIKRNGWGWRREEDWFFNEISILSSIRHRNVIKLLGCCLDASNPWIVFEFTPNGNLDDLIRSQVHRLPWPVRLRIAIGIGEALAYLHHHGQRPIIHRDVKPMNVLLDEDYNPKLGDFGLAILKPKDEEEADSIDIAGTLLYLDPYYLMTGVPTEKIDVYSFGVLLLVLFFWQLPSPRYQEPSVDEEQLALTAFMSIWEILGYDRDMDDRLFDVIKYFPITNAEIIPEEVGGTREQLGTFLELMFRCLNGRGEFRPTMKEVVRELKRMIQQHQQQQMELHD